MSEPVDVGCANGHVWTEWWSLPDGTDHRACGQCGWVQRRPDGGTWTDAVVIDRATAVIAAEACATLVDGQTEKTRSALAMIESALAGTEG